MPNIFKVLLEATVVGLLLIPMTYLAGFISKFITKKPALPDICSTWNKYYIMEVNLFIAGFLFHILSEVVGLNRWYAHNYDK